MYDVQKHNHFILLYLVTLQRLPPYWGW